jgi:hypothetical protein
MGDGLAQYREALRHWGRCYAGARPAPGSYGQLVGELPPAAARAEL